MLGRLRSMLAQPGFAGLVAGLGLMVVNWPFPDLARQAGDTALFAYYFGAWTVLVLLAFLLSRAAGDERDESGNV